MSKRLIAIGRNVIIKPDPIPAETISQGGIVIATEKSGVPENSIVYGTVTSIGMGGNAIREDGNEEFAIPDGKLMGKRVAYKLYDVREVNNEGEIFHAVDCDDIVGVDQECEGAVSGG